MGNGSRLRGNCLWLSNLVLRRRSNGHSPWAKVQTRTNGLAQIPRQSFVATPTRPPSPSSPRPGSSSCPGRPLDAAQHDRASDNTLAAPSRGRPQTQLSCLPHPSPQSFVSESTSQQPAPSRRTAGNPCAKRALSRLHFTRERHPLPDRRLFVPAPTAPGVVAGQSETQLTALSTPTTSVPARPAHRACRHSVAPVVKQTRACPEPPRRSHAPAGLHLLLTTGSRPRHTYNPILPAACARHEGVLRCPPAHGGRQARSLAPRRVVPRGRLHLQVGS